MEKEIYAPVITFFILVVPALFPGRYQGKHFFIRLCARLRFQFSAQVAGNQLDVVHQGRDIFEYLVVNALQNVIRMPGHCVFYQVGVMDMTGTIAPDTANLAAERKMGKHA